MDEEEEEDMRSKWLYRFWLVLLLATLPVLVGCPDDGDDGRDGIDGIDGVDGQDGVDAAARPIPTLEGHTSATEDSFILAYDVQAAFNDDTFFWRVSYRGNEGKRHEYIHFTNGAWQREGGDRRDAQASIDGDANQGNTAINSTIYEQRTSIMISDPTGAHPTDFDKFGCFLTCHDQLRHMPEWHHDHGEDGKYIDPSLVTGGVEGDAVLDLWHWRGARSNPVVRADDQWIEALTFVNVDEQDDSGRRGDSGTGVFRSQGITDGHPDFVFDPGTSDGVFAFNWDDFWLTPLFFMTDPDATEFGPLAPTPTAMPWEDAVALGYVPSEGDVVPRRVLRAGEGSRADITAYGTEFLPESGDGRLGVWHVQMQRLLDTGNADDVALVPGNTYDVGFEVHLWEYTTRDHYVSFPMKLRLGTPVAVAAVAPLDAEIVATPLTGSGTFPLPDWDDVEQFPKTRIYLFQPGITSWEFLTGADAGKVFFDPVAGAAVDQTHGGATDVSGATAACIDCHNVRLEDDRVPPVLNAGAMETLTRQRGGVWADTPVDNECGDGVVEGIEECDDGNTTGGDGCTADCTVEGDGVCGDGILDAGEECDDGNTVDGDGCAADCTDEAAIDGSALFESECGACHTGNGLGTGTFGDVSGATAAAISDAIAAVTLMNTIDLTAEEIQAIADTL
jgi:cysteine-rich repeat protein